MMMRKIMALWIMLEAVAFAAAPKSYTDEMYQVRAEPKIGWIFKSLLSDGLTKIGQHIEGPYRLYSTGIDALLHIGPSLTAAGDGSGKIQAPVSGVAILAFADTTINFQTGAVSPGGNVLTDGAAFALPATTIGQFRNVAFTARSDGKVDSHFSPAAASVGALENIGTTLSFIAGRPLGYATLQATAATAFKTAGSASNIIEMSVGGTPRVVRVSDGDAASSLLPLGSPGQALILSPSSTPIWSDDLPAPKTITKTGSGSNLAILNGATTQMDIATTATGITASIGKSTTPYLTADLHMFSNTTSFLTSTVINSSAAIHPALKFERARSSGGSPANTSSSDSLGSVDFYGYSTGAYAPAASILAQMTTGASGAEVPGRLMFQTTPPGGTVPLTHMLLSQDGALFLQPESTATAGVRFDPTGTAIFMMASNTSDTADDQAVYLASGGDADDDRGAFIQAFGNEFGSSVGGRLELHGGQGDAAGSGLAIALYTTPVATAQVSASINGNGLVTIGAAGASLVHQTNGSMQQTLVNGDTFPSGSTGGLTFGNSNSGSIRPFVAGTGSGNQSGLVLFGRVVTDSSPTDAAVVISGDTTAGAGLTSKDVLGVKNAAGSSLVRVKFDGGFTIVETAGGSGNTPHACQLRVNQCLAAQTCDVSCPSFTAYLATGGGCTMFNAWEVSQPTVGGSTTVANGDRPNGWYCQQDVNGTITAYVTCCIY